MKRLFAITLLALLTANSMTAADAAAYEKNWHQWRGPHANGMVPSGNPPVKWDEQTNIKWKVAIPGKGTASPIVWGDAIYLLTAVETDRKGPAPASGATRPEGRRSRFGGGRKPDNIFKFLVLCLDRRTGKEVWRKTACEAVPHEGHHSDHGYASATPVTNGKRIYASFNSRGVYCYNMKGNLIWNRDLGKMQTRNSFGEGASPKLYKDTLLVNWDHEGDSFIAALDARTGKTRWQEPRDERTNWTTPYVIEHKGKTQVIVNGHTRVRSYDFATGKLIWSCGGQTLNVIPTPVSSDRLVYCMSGFRGNAVYAIPLDSQGDITDTGKIAWKRTSSAPYVPSPLLYDGLLYFIKTNRATLTCVKAKTGEPVFEEQTLPELRGVYASPVGVAGRIYFVGRRGTTVVLEKGNAFKVLSINKLDDPIDASPAVVGKQMFLRGSKHLYCIEEK